MKRMMCALIGVLMIFLVGCQAPEPKEPMKLPAGVELFEGAYYAVGDYEKYMTPYIAIDPSHATFTYGGGAVVSYAEFGTYTIEGQMLAASFRNKSKVYFFEIKDSQTLELITDQGRELYVYSKELK